MTEVGRSLRDGLSQAEPEVSALRASIPSARTIDVSRRGWGYNVEVLKVLPGHRLKVAGWLPSLPDVGDYLILANERDTTRYRIDTIKPCSNPRDMFFAELSFAPRPASGIEAATADETRSGSAVGESPVPKADAQKEQLP